MISYFEERILFREY